MTTVLPNEYLYETCQPSNQIKTRISILSAVLFFLFASPWMYRQLNRAVSKIGIQAVNAEGCPSLMGLVLLAVLFGLVVRLLMH